MQYSTILILLSLIFKFNKSMIAVKLNVWLDQLIVTIRSIDRYCMQLYSGCWSLSVRIGVSSRTNSFTKPSAVPTRSPASNNNRSMYRTLTTMDNRQTSLLTQSSTCMCTLYCYVNMQSTGISVYMYALFVVYMFRIFWPVVHDSNSFETTLMVHFPIYCAVLRKQVFQCCDGMRF